MSTDRLTVAHALGQIAAFLEFRAENPFRVRAFRTAASTVTSLPGSVAEALADGSLAATRGIGPATLAIVKEFLESGRSSVLEQLKRESPEGLLELLEIPGLGVARIRLLHQQLGIETLAGLEAAARDGRLARLPRFGAKTAEKLLKSIAFAKGTRDFRLSHHAAAEAEVLRAAVAGLPGITRSVVAGEVRRRCEVVGELALVAVSDAPFAEIRLGLAELPGITAAADRGDARLSFRSAAGMAASVHLTRQADFGAALIYATGSPSHLEQLGAHAARTGWALNGGVLTRGGESVPTPEEGVVYQALGLATIPPELREGGDELARAAAGELPRLVEPADLVGLVHCHTTWSDGSLGVEELAQAAREVGYAYVGITDHSRSAGYVSGLSLERLRQQWDEIERVAGRLSGIRILKGIESDILLDGRLDYEDAVLAEFDFVIGSIHSRFSLSETEMTARVLRALENPHLTILGHPTGRLLLSRSPCALDFEQVFATAAANGVALEINGHPHRLDLDWRLVRRARELGVVFAIGADAHSRADFANSEFGTAIARKGGLEKGDVLNTRPVDQFLAFARARRI